MVGAELRDVSGVLLDTADVDGEVAVPEGVHAFYVRAAGYQLSVPLITWRLQTEPGAAEAGVNLELDTYSAGCSQLAGDWSSTGWQSYRVWFGLDGDPDTDWQPVASEDQMRVFVDPEDFGWADVRITGPYVDGADGYWLQCSPRGTSQTEVFLTFAPLNMLQHGTGLPARFPAVGEIPEMPVTIWPGRIHLPALSKAELGDAERWYGWGNVNLGRWLFGALPGGAPAECDGVPSVATGDVLVGGSGAEAELARLRCYTRIEGNLQFGPSSFAETRIELPLLEEVSGELRIFNSLDVTDFSFPRLTRVGTALRIVDTLTIERVAMPALQEVANIEIRSNQVLGAVAFPSLEEASQGMLISGGAIESLDVSSLRQVGILVIQQTGLSHIDVPRLVASGPTEDGSASIQLQSNTSLVRAEFGALTEVGAALRIDATADDCELAFPLLEVVEGTLALSRTHLAGSPDFGSLVRVGGHLELVGQAPGQLSVPSLTFPMLQQVDECLTLSAIDGLESVNFPLLHTVGGCLWIRDSPDLIGLVLPALETVGVTYQGGATSLHVLRNDVLDHIRMRMLLSADDVWVTDNPMLQELDLEALHNCGNVSVRENGMLCVSQAAQVYEQCGEELYEYHNNLDGC